MNISAERFERCVNELATRNGHHVERPAAGLLRLVRRRASKHFTQPALCAISNHGRADPLRSNDAQPIASLLVRLADERHVAGGDTPPAPLHRLKFDV
jgi:hypothetical protein